MLYGKTVIDQNNGFAREIRHAIAMELGLVVTQPFPFFLDDIFQIRTNERIPANHSLVQHHNTIFRKGAYRKFAMPWMPDLSNDHHIERKMQFMRYFRGDDHSASRQTHNQIDLSAFLFQVAGQLLTSIFA